MRRIALGIVMALAAAPASAASGTRTIAPPGNSGVNQYVESIPTANGNQPTGSVHHAAGGAGGSHGSSGGPGATGSGRSGSGSGGSGAGASGTGVVSSAAAGAVARQGADGRAAAALAVATAPTIAHGASARPGSPASRQAVTKSVSAVSRSANPSPVSSIVKAFTGSSSGGGLGPLLPIILVVSLLGASGLAILRHRRTT